MTIQIYINGKPETLKEPVSLIDFLEEKGIKPEVISVEINGELLKREDFKKALLKEGDEVEIVFHLSGGEKYQSVLELIGKTPLLRLNSLPTNGAELWAKLESYNPGGSVKDRIALSMILDAEEKGIISAGDTIVEPTSGNTGIGLAMIAAIKGYRLILTMPEGMSQERVEVLKSFGAEVILTSAEEGMKGAVEKAREVAEKEGAFIPQQFENLANPEIHRKTTAKEVWEDLNGDIDAFVAGVGTGGTITGVGEVLKKRKPSVLIVAVEPATSPVLSGGKPGSHRIQGIGAGFIPKVLNLSVIDEVVAVKDDEAFGMSRVLAKKEGILVGISSGAACVAALKISQRLGEGKKVVTIFPDTGERYISLIPYFQY